MFRATYLDEGAAPAPGRRLVQPRLARTLERLAREGGRAFYEGDLAAEIGRACEAAGSPLRASDLAVHHSRWADPITVPYRGGVAASVPPPCQGLVALAILGMLEGMDVGDRAGAPADYVHLLVEATKLAFGDRDRWLADPERTAVPVGRLLDPAYLRERGRRIRMDRAAPGPAESGVDRGDTIACVTADAAGNCVSLIQSLYHEWGSGVIAGETGVVLQNRGAGFTLDTAHANALAPGKRPFHTLTPFMYLRDGRPFLVAGTMGGRGSAADPGRAHDARRRPRPRRPGRGGGAALGVRPDVGGADARARARGAVRRRRRLGARAPRSRRAGPRALERHGRPRAGASARAGRAPRRGRRPSRRRARTRVLSIEPDVESSREDAHEPAGSRHARGSAGRSDPAGLPLVTPHGARQHEAAVLPAPGRGPADAPRPGRALRDRERAGHVLRRGAARPVRARRRALRGRRRSSTGSRTSPRTSRRGSSSTVRRAASAASRGPRWASRRRGSTMRFRARARANLTRFERRVIAPAGRRPAAVAAVLLADDDGRACFLLTRRAATLRAHATQWALPGGRIDEGETPEARGAARAPRGGGPSARAGQRARAPRRLRDALRVRDHAGRDVERTRPSS